MKKAILVAIVIACSIGLRAEYAEPVSAPAPVSYWNQFVSVCSRFLSNVKSVASTVLRWGYFALDSDMLACHVGCFKQEASQVKAALIAELIPIIGEANAAYLDMFLDQLIESQQVKPVADLGQQAFSVLMQRIKNGESVEHAVQSFNQTLTVSSNVMDPIVSEE